MTFAAPLALVALAALPLLWWLLRVTPPSPRQERFPAIRLLLGLNVTFDCLLPCQDNLQRLCLICLSGGAKNLFSLMVE